MPRAYRERSRTRPSTSSAIPADPVCPDGLSWLLAFGRRLGGLGDHVYRETGVTHFGGHLRYQVPDGPLIGTDVDALGFSVTLPDGRRQAVHVDGLIVKPSGAVLGDRHYRHFLGALFYRPHFGNFYLDAEFHDVRGEHEDYQQHQYD